MYRLGAAPLVVNKDHSVWIPVLAAYVEKIDVEQMLTDRHTHERVLGTGVLDKFYINKLYAHKKLVFHVESITEVDTFSCSVVLVNC